MTSSELSKVYDTLMCGPGMNDPVKLNYQPTRRFVLLLSQVIEQAVRRDKQDGETLLAYIPGEAEQLLEFSNDWLEKAGMKALAEKLKVLHK
ncbi:hypothetical protein [Chitinophaga barathri]|uniref:Uncharacterized protein n=1 Tax=Chitinophaga barathri TaxID=1647451 RepID=A0A3N4M7G9_9BACT|nr:hypothetical protein [Chitinophaga barathri]RPD39311.1 hypothetical protein EG028_19485 [Chitinophaga barathri]